MVAGGNVLGYQVAVLVLLIIGLVAALAFLSQHRPKQWRRLAAWDASGWVLLVALIFVRQIGLLVSRWPGPSSVGVWDAVFGLGLLVLIDVLLLVRLASYRSFVEQDRRSASG
ncbi:hypothetical protein ABT336_13245 [Micromonospora sp. NPDC000207]|uniref:hypothetical protein n=1 Tax=Micromonospora sp. NPDC000207 TaxID=3154246 RepID=UPI003319AADC